MIDRLNIIKFQNRKWVNMATSYLNRNGKLIDIGCGKQLYYDILKPCSSLYVAGDNKSSSEYLKSLRKPDVFFDACFLPFRNQTFDSALCINVLEHIYEVHRAISEISRILKSKGILILITPFQHRIHMGGIDYWRFTFKALDTMLKEDGFTIKYSDSLRGMWLIITRRLAAYLYSDLMRIDSSKGFRKFIKMSVISPFVLALHVAGCLLNKVHYVEDDVLSYFIIAERQ